MSITKKGWRRSFLGLIWVLVFVWLTEVLIMGFGNCEWVIGEGRRKFGNEQCTGFNGCNGGHEEGIAH
ncbi:MAG: hypothetical protein ICV61_12170 [Microcoleus sp. Co-bin12]|nr:hypothetical protein [Microcoleus sp. Co-bin12]